MATLQKQPYAEAVNHSAILTKLEAAEYLRVSKRYIERAVKEGRVRAYKPTPGLFRVKRSDLDAYLESGASFAA